ncbi:MAG: right-handed parallel beta-helix repeat-containing protein [Bacteroidia bacterium]|nr:right-handed parallel beta-helix repeat-containing protein [Bacteroidia bacterium]
MSVPLRTTYCQQPYPGRVGLLGFIGVWILSGCAWVPGQQPRIVPTYESLGISWSPLTGGRERTCAISYRQAGDTAWETGFPLWYDKRDLEYRGSLVSLRPGTTYEIRLQTSGPLGTEGYAVARTWDESPPVADTVWVCSSAEPLEICQGGAATGYVLYLPCPGDAGIVDVQHQYDYCVNLDASYVILRGLTLRGARMHGVQIGLQQDLIIERCDISGWGRPAPGFEAQGFGENFDAGIYSQGDGDRPRRITIQDNHIHHPRYGANHWEETGPRGNHPYGPQAISVLQGGGHYVIRYNAIYSSEGHYFNDAMGEWRNFTFEGFPGRDTDIAHNYISHCRDNAIEAEGGNQNVRIWANYTTHTYRHIATANTNLGPVYIWRNVSGLAERAPGDNRAFWTKIASLRKPDPEGMEPQGMIYVFHNTLTQPLVDGKPMGVADALASKTLYTRNNIFWCSLSQGAAAIHDAAYPENSFDYDLYNGQIEGPPGSERHGIRDQAPVYAPDNQPADPARQQGGTWFLSPGSPGHDAGTFVPGFSQGAVGAGPDMGAFEAGGAGIWFGPRKP